MENLKPVAYKGIDEHDRIMLWLDKPAYKNIEPLYTHAQLQPRVKMTHAEYDETVALLDRSGDRVFGRLYEVLTVIKENPSDDRYYNLYLRLFGSADDVIDSEKQCEFAKLFMLKNPEETIDIIPENKWFVRSKDHDDGGLYGWLIENAVDFVPEYLLSSNIPFHAMEFDTKDQAELWTNPLTEALLLPVSE